MEKKHNQHAETCARKRQIIKAALDCFAEKGYVETTMEDIRVRSGASTGSIYHHFKSKDELAAAVYIEGIKDYQDGLISAVKDLSARDGVCEIVRFHLDWIGKNILWSQYLFAMRHADFMKISQDSISKHNAEFYEKISKWFRKHVAAGELRRLPRDLCTSIIWGSGQEYAKLWLAGKRNVKDLEFAARELGDAAWQALRATEKQER